MTTPRTLVVRPVTTADIPDWLTALKTVFLRTTDPLGADAQPEALAERMEPIDPARTLGAFDDTAPHPCVATFRSFPQQLTAVGGTAVPADAISNVGVLPTHRRRGLLSRMMAHDLAAAKERGDVVATLVPTEYPIYGRFGFGPATHTAEWTVEVPRSGLDPRWSAPEDGGRIDLVDGADVRKLGPGLHDRLRAAQPGAVDRSDLWWRAATGLVRFGRPWTEPFHATFHSASGELEGLVTYTCDDEWGGGTQPQATVQVSRLIATTPAAERALWHHLCSIDLVTRVRSGHRAPDDLLPHLLPDPRAARLTTLADHLWVRILDVVRALEARTYEGEGTLVLEVVDGGGLAGGRYRLEAGADGAHCAETTEDPDLTLAVGDLAPLWLGDESAARLAALGRVWERREGAVRMADALLRTSRRPWCPDIF
ncbi:putative acetyltransferase [Streptomyces sp. B3I7]|uniref:GNAT family N-acetyltransferase n=1 Tax=Streptomyces sp. B3I7 TaxID=3042269 RepID=UPI0027836576|nr:GNAT family N-acetyltransferase [Streptomyces sp. B3I7]MDQ0812630.1 putative acetyltransferase [Streptomyces sp. B3I7]